MPQEYTTSVPESENLSATVALFIWSIFQQARLLIKLGSYEACDECGKRNHDNAPVHTAFGSS
jgi:hypothetical protein